MFVKKYHVAYAFCLPLVLPAAAWAQPSDSGAAADDHDSTIVVTANRMPMRLDQVGQSVTVLDRQAIEASQATGITELLAQTPGVQFARNGGPGKSTSIYIRGADTGQTVILFDGVRLNDPSSADSGASMADILAGDIAQIEVLRGAQSTLWGSQAIGGVINIRTLAPHRPFEANGQVEAGGLETYQARAGLGGRQGKLTWRLGGSYFKTTGVSAIASGTEPDGYENVSANGRLAYRFTDHVALDLRSFYSFGRNEFDAFDGDAPVYGKSRQWLNYAGLNVDLFGVLQNRIAYSNTDIKRTNYDASPGRAAQPLTFDAAGTTDRYEYQGTLALARGWSAVFGFERAENWMRTASPSVAIPHPVPISASDSTDGLYAQLQGEVAPGLTLTGGLRHEAHSAFGGKFVGSASAAWSLNNGDTVLRASWAEGFKAPSLYQLYSQYGNPGLAAETASSWDVGIEQRLFGRLSVSAVYFNRETENLINYMSCTVSLADHPLCAPPRTAFYENIGRVHAEGVELGTSLNLGAFTASANYTLLDAKNSTPGDVNQGKRLARRPRDSFNATLSYTWPIKLVTALAVRYAGDSFDNAANTVVLKDYALVDIRLSLPISRTLEIYGRVENLFDQRYETAKNYGSYPRVAYGGVRVKF
ncbi:MAG TPA: TonB-dependent receptor [Sphingobium sp.]|nr:TonB-dependent receptor [Sphingobium sp.]